MIEVFMYWIMQKLGYRKHCYDAALSRGIRLSSYEGWLWRPWMEKGTYREKDLKSPMEFTGYGVDA